jgi:phospholipid/cholesterol/gamma-HCH transport system permease protein
MLVEIGAGTLGAGPPMHRSADAAEPRPPARVELASGVLKLAGRLDARTTGPLWRRALNLADEAGAGTLRIDATELEYCDGAGANLLVALRQARGRSAEIHGLRPEIERLLQLVEPGQAAVAAPGAPARLSPVAAVGRAALQRGSELRELVVFVGELTVQLVRALREPRRIRARDVLRVAERAGIGAVPIVALIGLLLGLILAFQSAIPMRRFGADIFVADLLGISLLRELGALMAAILLAARSGSAFAAELGTMKVNEEVDALSTMGLEPVRFLVVPRVIAAFLVIPVLAMLMNVAGLLGGAIVMASLGYPLVVFVDRVTSSVTVGDLAGGLFKALVFGLVVAGIGCLRGLQTGKGAGAVGQSTTSSVVSGIILIAAIDGLFAVAFFLMGI